MGTDLFPPINFIPVPSAVEGIEVYQPAPVKLPAHREVVQFNCPQCGANTAYSAADSGLTCTNCGFYEPPEHAVVGIQAQRFEFTVDTVQRAAQGWGEARKELQCQSCGAYTTISTDSLTHTCIFCGSNQVIQHAAPQDVLRPRFIVPFKIEAEACHDIARQWLGQSWMTPRSLRRVATIARFTGIYLPFWTFETVTKAHWQAEVGHNQTERYYENGEWRTRTKTVWQWESGRVTVPIKDLVIAGTNRVSPLLLTQVKNDNLAELAPYEPKYLAGLQAQTYDIPLETAWEQARHLMREQTRRACYDQASNSKIRNFHMNLDFDQEGWRYILLPMYLTTYQFDNQRFQVMINGQTGAIAGQRPVDWTVLWLAVAALLAPGLTVGVLGFLTLMLGGLGFPIAIFGFILVVIGLIISFNWVNKAMRMDDA
ncbi:MAG: hypothetical protein H6631_19885 [Anaerolineaceae bacterium]|nr:hypothetical protein [Anaerolineaceae bacterium]MCB9100449.1 hypothetical protein [Anaerolineales bacterium]